ncbi:carboxypeptidase regulatory-like domain-containing protein [Halobacteriales archaeon Cl-PHB]
MLETLHSDERAIEGLPIRLVIALVVGVASLSVMMGMISDLDSLGTTEVDVRPAEDVIEETDETRDFLVTVVDSSGNPVADATVYARSGTAEIDGIETGQTSSSGRARLEISPSLGPNQVEGTIELEVKPPAGEFVDRRENTKVLVVENKG